MTNVAASGGWPRQGLEPLDLRRDLRQVADLLDVAFREEKRDTPVPLQSAFSAVRALAPVLWLMAPLVPAIRGMFTGFVWLEDGRVVGNINVTRAPRGGDVWLIGNVAVHPGYRRQGIGRRLTQAAVELARERGARWVVLDVRDDNAGAQALYNGLGFQQVGGTREFYLSAARLRRARGEILPPVVLLPGGLEGTDDVPGTEAWRLVSAAVAPAAPELLGLTPQDFRLSGAGRLLAALTAPLLGESRFGIGVRDRAGHLAGWAGLDNAPGRMGNRLRMAVDPAWRGLVERWLVTEAMARLGAAPAIDCWAVVPLGERDASAVLEEAGFIPSETLLRLALPVR